MAEKKSFGKFFVYCILTLGLLLVMLSVVFSFKGKLIRAESLVMLFLMFLSLVGFTGYSRSWGERVLFFMFVIALGNLILIWHFTGNLFMLPLFLSMIGFMMALPKKKDTCCGCCTEVEPHSMVFDEPPKKTELPDVKAEDKKVEVVHSPGKYVASSMGSVYHEPKCQWAKKIVETRRIWFKDKKEAQRKKYKAHKCVQ
ncbi:hypothetical protein GOV03_02500 [Candidatus Woesearchaeota archaeon]|nr:hypothetical protein [Candidatus Woesearchaeota archaeon]